MNSSPGLDLGNWVLELLTAAVIAAMGWIVAAFNRSKHQIEARVDALERDTGTHDTRLAVAQTCQENTERRLTEIKETTKDTNEKLDTLSNTLTAMLVALKTKS